MSANNYILIKQTDKYEIWDKDADTNSGYIVDTKKTLREAIKATDDIDSEYGIYFDIKND